MDAVQSTLASQQDLMKSMQGHLDSMTAKAPKQPNLAASMRSQFERAEWSTKLMLERLDALQAHVQALLTRFSQHARETGHAVRRDEADVVYDRKYQERCAGGQCDKPRGIG